MHKHRHAHTQTQIQTHADAHTHTHTRTHTHARTDTHTHTHATTHMQLHVTYARAEAAGWDAAADEMRHSFAQATPHQGGFSKQWTEQAAAVTPSSPSISSITPVAHLPASNRDASSAKGG